MRRTMLWIGLLALLTGCGAAQSGAPTATSSTAAGKAQLVVMTHDSFAVSKEVIAAFEQQSGATVTLLPSGDAGASLNKAILSKGSPLADVLYGVDNSFLSRALDADIFEPYASPALAQIPDRLRLDATDRLLPVDFGYVTINYDKAVLAAAKLQPPADLRALTQPAWKGRLVVQNPATSSPGLAFLLATVATFGESGGYSWKDFWRELRANDVLVSEGWSDAYNAQFSGGAGKGPRPLVVSYATSPAAELVFAADPKPSAPPTGSVDAGAFEQTEFVGILKGTKQRQLAEQFVDFMLSKPFQEDMPLQMFVYPARSDAALPAVFTTFAALPATPKQLTPAEIGAGRERWIAEWTQIVLR